MSLRNARLLAGLAVLAVTVSGIGPAHAADPSGTVTLASGPSAYDLEYAPLVHTTRGTIFVASSGAAVIVSDGGSPSPFSLASSYLTSACTDTVISAYPLDNEPFVWTNVVTGDTGEAKVTSGRFLLGATPDGWLETQDTSSGGVASTEIHRRYTGSSVDQVIATVHDPGDSTSSPFLSSDSYTCDATGYAVTAFNATGSSIIVGSFSGSDAQALVTDPGTGAYTDLHPAAISGQTVVYGQDVYDDNLFLVSGKAFRKTVGQSATTLSSSGLLTAAGIGATSTAYAVADIGTGLVSLKVRTDSGTTTTPTQPGDWSPWLAWPDGTGFGVASYGSAGGGVYSATSSAVSSVWVPSGGSLSASAISLSAGRAVWADDRQKTNPVWSRPVTGTSTLTAGQEARVGTGALTLGGDLLADGRRTVWSDGDTEHLEVHDGNGISDVAVVGSPSAISGHRVLDAPGLTTSTTHVVDLVSGLVTPGGSNSVLWGDRMAGVDGPTGAIVVSDAATGQQSGTITPAAAGVPSGGAFVDLALEGDVLAWTWIDDADTSPTFGLGWKNLSSGTVTQADVADPTLPLARPSVYGNLVAVDSITSADVYDATDGGLAKRVTGADHPVIGPVGLAWVDHSTREPKVSPMPNQHLVPRHEGNPLAAPTYALSLGSWSGEWVFTEPLSSCHVAISDAADAPVVTLPCDAADAAYGEAVAAWDGKDSGGTTVAPGTYHWTVQAGDANGPAVDVDGTSTDISGTIDVTATPPAYVSLTPSRILDTRYGNGAPKKIVAGGGTVTLQVTGRGGVPEDGVDAVVLNVTATNATGGGYVTAYPNGSSRPTASSLNYVKDRPIANQVVAKLGAGGKVTLYVSAAAHVVADVEGYYPTGAAYTSLTPTRLLDTRLGLGAPKAKVGAGKQVSLAVTGQAGIPADAAAVILNVTVTQPAGGGYVTAYPNGSSRPTASNINYVKDQTIAGMVVAKVGASGKVNLYTSASAHLVADVVGWMPAGADYHALNPARLLDTRTGNGAPKATVKAAHAVSVKVTGRGGVPADATTVMLTVAAVSPGSGGYLTVFPKGVTRPTASNLNFVKRATIANSVIAKVGAGGYVTIYTSSTTHLIADVSGYWTS